MKFPLYTGMVAALATESLSVVATDQASPDALSKLPLLPSDSSGSLMTAATSDIALSSDGFESALAQTGSAVQAHAQWGGGWKKKLARARAAAAAKARAAATRARKAAAAAKA